MLPWSVMAQAGMPSLDTRLASSSGRLAPSRREYSVWRWRCANDIEVSAHSTRRERRSSAKTARALLVSAAFKEDFAHDKNDEVARSSFRPASRGGVRQHGHREHVVLIV